MTHPYFPWFMRKFALLPAILFALALALGGCVNDHPSELEAAQTPPPQPAGPGAPAAAPATPPVPPLLEKTMEPGPAVATAAPPAAMKQAPASGPKTPKVKYEAGEDPEYAKKCGWPMKYPPPLPGSILPQKRIVAYYGNPKSKKMGALGEYPKDEMLKRLKEEVAKWEKADPSLPVQPALHLVAVVAQGEPGKTGKYRMIHPDALVNEVYGWAKEINGILFIDRRRGRGGTHAGRQRSLLEDAR